jgi:hypothetical protein
MRQEEKVTMAVTAGHEPSHLKKWVATTDYPGETGAPTSVPYQ